MATASSAIPATGSVGQLQRATARLAIISLLGGVASPFLVGGSLFMALLYLIYDEQPHWLVLLSFLAGLVLAIGAVVAGIAVFRRARAGAETPSRNKSLVGIVFGGVTLVAVGLIASLSALARISDWLLDVLRDSPAFG